MRCCGNGSWSTVCPPPRRSGEVLDDSVPTAVLGDSAAEALILMLDRNAEFLLVTDGGRRAARHRHPAGLHRLADHRRGLDSRAGAPGVDGGRTPGTDSPGPVGARRPAVPATGLRQGHHRLLRDRRHHRPAGDHARSSQQHPELSIDAFTWLSLGSNGRREATPSSDIDSAVAFDDAIGDGEIDRYRVVFGKINRLLAGAGLTADDHGATADRPAFARTNASWRSAAQEWLVSPEKNQGAIMTSLLVDGRPIHGDPGLPAVTEVFQEVRRHPGTMRLLMQESLSKRARFRSMRDIFTRRETFDIKTHALLPIVNIARWVGLSVGSPALPTTERLKAAAGSAMLPDEQADNLIEAFEVVQRLRLRYQIEQYERGREAVRPAGPRSAVADRPQHARPGRARDRRGPAPDGQCRGLPARRRLVRAGTKLRGSALTVVAVPMDRVSARAPATQVLQRARIARRGGSRFERTVHMTIVGVFRPQPACCRR